MMGMPSMASATFRRSVTMWTWCPRSARSASVDSKFLRYPTCVAAKRMRINQANPSSGQTPALSVTSTASEPLDNSSRPAGRCPGDPWANTPRTRNTAKSTRGPAARQTPMDDLHVNPTRHVISSSSSSAAGHAASRKSAGSMPAVASASRTAAITTSGLPQMVVRSTSTSCGSSGAVRSEKRRWCTELALSVSNDQHPGHRGDGRCMISI